MKHKGECSVFITETVSDLLKNYTPALHKYCPQFKCFSQIILS